MIRSIPHFVTAVLSLLAMSSPSLAATNLIRRTEDVGRSDIIRRTTPVNTGSDPWGMRQYQQTSCGTLVASPQGSADHIVDVTASLQSLINQLPSGGTLCLTPGYYWIDAIHSLLLKSNMTLKLETGAILKAIPNNSGSYSVLRLYGLMNVSVLGGEIHGERDAHTVVDLNAPGEWGFGLDIRGAQNVTVQTTLIKDCWGDGIYLGRGLHGEHNSNIQMIDVTADHNRRQGITIIDGQGVSLIRPHLINTTGTAAAAGLDIEPNHSDDKITAVSIQNPITENNAGFGLQFYLPALGAVNPADITISDPVDSGSAKGPFFLNLYSGVFKIYNPDWTPLPQNVQITQNVSFQVIQAYRHTTPGSCVGNSSRSCR